jgi:hypothetical protein
MLIFSVKNYTWKTGYSCIYQYFNIVAFLATEIDFWNSRLKNLESIYDQLRDQRVKKMASILELTDSAYFPCFKTQFRDIVAGE